MPQADHRPVPARRWDFSGGIAACAGAIIGMVAFVCGRTLGFVDLVLSLGPIEGVLAALVIGALLIRFRIGRWVLVTSLLFVLAVYAVVRYTDVTDRMVHALRIVDAAQSVDAIVVLTSWRFEDGSPNFEGTTRLVRGLELAAQGYAPRLIVTRLPGSAGQEVEQATRMLMANLGVRADLFIVGPIVNTHDEAVHTAALAAEHGWRHVILVTTTVHSRRAVETFRKAGLIVTSVPNPPDFGPVPRGGLRINAFQACLHEYVGRFVYRRRGWI